MFDKSDFTERQVQEVSSTLSNFIQESAARAVNCGGNSDSGSAPSYLPQLDLIKEPINHDGSNPSDDGRSKLTKNLVHVVEGAPNLVPSATNPSGHESASRDVSWSKAKSEVNRPLDGGEHYMKMKNQGSGPVPSDGPAARDLPPGSVTNDSLPIKNTQKFAEDIAKGDYKAVKEALRGDGHVMDHERAEQMVKEINEYLARAGRPERISLEQTSHYTAKGNSKPEVVSYETTMEVKIGSKTVKSECVSYEPAPIKQPAIKQTTPPIICR